MAGLLARVGGFFGGRSAKEGEYRPGPYDLSTGILSASVGRYWNWWQMGYSPSPLATGGAIVEACVSAYSQTVAMCPGAHWQTGADAGRTRVANSALARILKRPNDYQTISDFLLNLTRSLYDSGEVFALAVRDGRQEPKELHLMRKGQVRLAETGDVFYSLSGNTIAERRFDLSEPIPARDVLHIRLHTPLDPLKGISPLLATMLERQLSGAALSQQVAYYLNQARPSFMLESDQQLTADQTRDLRQRWNEQTQGDAAGGTPILSHGLKAKEVSGKNRDAQLAEIMKLSDQNIALAFRMPLQVLGLGGTTFASTESLMQFWIGSGLGFCLNHIEEAFGQLFGLKGYPDEYVEFDTKALLRSSYKERIEALRLGVIGGIMSPDEARAEEGLPKVAGGHGEMPRVQQQVVPLSYGTDMKPPAPATVAPPSDDEDEDDDASRSSGDFARQIDELVSRHAESVH